MVVNIMIYFLVGMAGALGAVVRYIVGIALITDSHFPYATLLINLIGSFGLAWLTANVFIRTSVSPSIATIVGTGFVGSFTTFSALSVETVNMFNRGDYVTGFIYVAISVFGGLFLSRLGFKANIAVNKS
jgi:fluoride exporter